MALPLFLDVKRVTPQGRPLSNLSSETAGEKGVGGTLALKEGTAIIDLRQRADFEEFSLPGSVNLPFANSSSPSPFSDPAVLEALWSKLDNYFSTPPDDLGLLLQGKRIMVLCYDGDSSRVATSVLRAKGYEADSVRGGFQAVKDIRAREAVNAEPPTNTQAIKQGIAVAREVELVMPS